MDYEHILGVLGIALWFIFPFGVFLSVIRQDREALPPPKETQDEHLKIFAHKSMLYNDYDEPLSNEPSSEDETVQDNEFNHPHVGIGSSHVHHLQ